MVRHAAVVLAGALLLAACATQRTCEPIRVPVPVPQPPRVVIQPIEPALLRAHPEATGALRDCPDIARHNLEAVRACNHDKATLRQQQGTTPPHDGGQRDE